MSQTKKKKLVIVESPMKAKTISRFLGPEYVVESCMGHIRDLPSSSKELPEELKKKSWAKFGVDVDNDFSPFYCVPANKKEIVRMLKSKMKSVGELILATDEDREGESISWHLKEILNPNIPVKRMVFHEITKPAIQEALKNFRKVDNNLVQAQEARRILDRLVGYSISPFLWKKVARGLSAGRVQSVAVSLVSQREIERLNFKQSFYWDVEAENKKGSSLVFKSRLVAHKGKQLVNSSHFNSTTGELKKTTKDILILNEKEASQLVKNLTGKDFQVKETEKKEISRKPSPPFITSTLQQECNRKLRLSSRDTMSVAQKLYERGLITYMRTDSTFLSNQALQSARKTISQLYGPKELPSTPRVYSKKVAGAQEAHEAIRPAGTQFVKPNQTGLQGVLLSVYDLIWKKTLASQMKNCIQNQVRVTMEVEQSTFLSSGVTIQSPGFYLLYQDKETEEVKLPVLKKGEKVSCLKLMANEHQTRPPARYTEASLIQKLEKEGVGRPSTYASIIGTIQERGYVNKEKNALAPTFTALVVSRLLNQYFPDYVDTKFTSAMEKDLDDIACGKKDLVKYLRSVYLGSKGLKKLVEKQEKNKDDKNSRSLVLRGFEEYSFNVGPFGPYVSRKNGKKKEESASLPANLYPSELKKEMIEQLLENKKKGGKLLGKDSKTKESVFLLVGRYGPYVQLGKSENKEDSEKVQASKNKSKISAKKGSSKKGAKSEGKAKTKKIYAKNKKISISPFFDEESITLSDALKLLELPKVLGQHPETKKDVKKGVGKFGPYIVHGSDFRSVPSEGFFDLNLKYALNRLKESKARSSHLLKDLGKDSSGHSVQLMKGRFGPYIKCNGKNHSLPSGFSPDSLDLESALELISQKLEKTTKGKKTNKKAVFLRRAKRSKKRSFA